MVRKPWFGIVLSALALLDLIIAAAGGAVLSVILTVVLFIVALIWTIKDLIHSIKAKDKKRIAIILSRIVAVFLICFGILGVAMVHQDGAKSSDFDQAINMYRDIGIENYMVSSLGPMKLFYVFARDRKVLIIIGVLILLVPAGIWAFKKYVKKEPTAATAGTRAVLNQHYQPVSQPVSQPISQPVSQPGNWAAQHTGPTQPQRLRICDDQCCICGRNLVSGYAPLFQLPNGKEARIDEGCWNAVNIVYNGNNPQQITQAVNYLYGQMPMVDPVVVPYLQEYMRIGNQRRSQFGQ